MPSLARVFALRWQSAWLWLLFAMSVFAPMRVRAQQRAPAALHRDWSPRQQASIDRADVRGDEVERTETSSTGAHYGLLAAGVVAAATGNQVIASPTGWAQTWRGYGYRLGDQIAFAVVEESVRALVGTTVDWVPDTVPCGPSAQRDTGMVTRDGPGFVRRVGCAVRQTALMRTPAGAGRPNLPFAAGVVLASVASVAWRPEGKDPVKARALVATRIGVVFGASAGTQLVTTWWQDRSTRRPLR